MTIDWKTLYYKLEKMRRVYELLHEDSCAEKISQWQEQCLRHETDNYIDWAQRMKNLNISWKTYGGRNHSD